jgi:hypothetical protein
MHCRDQQLLAPERRLGNRDWNFRNRLRPCSIRRIGRLVLLALRLLATTSREASGGKSGGLHMSHRRHDRGIAHQPAPKSTGLANRPRWAKEVRMKRETK